MKFIEIPASDFDLAMTLDSGQVFHWEKADNGFVGTIGDWAVYIEECGELLRARAPHTPRCKRPNRRSFPRIHCRPFPNETPGRSPVSLRDRSRMREFR